MRLLLTIKANTYLVTNKQGHLEIKTKGLQVTGHSPHSRFEEKKKTPSLKKKTRFQGKKALFFFFFTILFPLISILLTFINTDIRNYV